LAAGFELNKHPGIAELKDKISKLEFLKESESNYKISEASKKLVAEDAAKLPKNDSDFGGEFFWAFFELMSFHTGREMVDLRNTNRIKRRELLKVGKEVEYRQFLANNEQTSREAATQEMTMFIFEVAGCHIVKFYQALDNYTKTDEDKKHMKKILTDIDVKIKTLLEI